MAASSLHLLCTCVLILYVARPRDSHVSHPRLGASASQVGSGSSVQPLLALVEELSTRLKAEEASRAEKASKPVVAKSNVVPDHLYCEELDGPRRPGVGAPLIDGEPLTEAESVAEDDEQEEQAAKDDVSEVQSNHSREKAKAAREKTEAAKKKKKAEAEREDATSPKSSVSSGPTLSEAKTLVLGEHLNAPAASVPSPKPLQSQPPPVNSTTHKKEYMRLVPWLALAV